MIWYMIWCDMIRCDMIRCDIIYDMIWCDVMWYDIWYDMVDVIWYIWYDMMWCDVIWYMILYDVMWYDIWYDMMWCDMIYDMMWCDMIYDMMWYDIWYDILYAMIWCEMIYDMVWYDVICYDVWYDKIWCDMIYLLIAIVLTPGGSSTVHIYTQTVHRTTQITNWEECGPCPVFAGCTLAFALQPRKKHGKTSVRVAEEWQLARWKQNIQNRTYITIRIHNLYKTKQKHTKHTTIHTVIKKNGTKRIWKNVINERAI